MNNVVYENLQATLTEIKRRLNVVDTKVARVVSNSPIELEDVSFLRINDWITNYQSIDYSINSIDFTNKIIQVNEAPVDFAINSSIYWHQQNQIFIDLFNSAKTMADNYLANPFWAWKFDETTQDYELVHAVPEGIKDWCIQYVARFYSNPELAVTTLQVQGVGNTNYTSDIFNQIQGWRLHAVTSSINLFAPPRKPNDQSQGYYGYVQGVKYYVFY